MSTEINEVWKHACGKLRAILNEDTYDRWITGIMPLSIAGSTCLLGVSNEIFSDWLAMNYRDVIGKVLAEILGHPVDVAFESGHDILAVQTSEAEQKVSSQAKMATVKNGGNMDGRYNQRFTFDSFVVGENNKFAHAAACAVAHSPGKAYNPLFIYGATGLGKTHLLQAMAQELLQRRKRARVEYLSSEDFANIFIDALRDRALPTFRRHYRNVDLLLIDDVHFFQGKEQFQEEFFHTFNTLYNAHKQIVLTSDRPPHAIGGLEKRLVSRFEWGLTTDIQSPDLETRIAILRKKQVGQDVDLGDDLLFFIASRIKSNIRRLEGALLRLVSYVSVTGNMLTRETAETLLGSLLDEEAVALITVDQIQRKVAEYYDIRLADMTSKRRPRNIAFPRQVAMYLCRKLTDQSSPRIAESFNRNHATVLHAVTTVEHKAKADPEFGRDLVMLERKIRG